MTSLRGVIATLPPYLRAPINFGEVARYVHMERPLTLNALANKITSLPETVTFHSIIETGAALGGEATIVLSRDGNYRFSGFMNASGLESFSFRVGAVVRSASNQVTVATQHSGKVFGFDTPGDRTNSWDEAGTDLERMKVIRNVWPDISAGSMSITRSSDVAGLIGTAANVIKDVAEFLLVAETGGASLAICLVLGAELGNLGETVPGLGGVVGIGIVAGSLFIWGPLAIGPGFLLGVAVGAIVDLMVKIRRLTADEITFARQVFGDSLDFDRVRLTNLLGATGTPFTLPAVDDTILINIGDGVTFDAPTTASFGKYIAPGQILIHELTHAWQIQHRTLEDGYVPGYLCAGANAQVIEGKAAYRYGAAGATWRSYGIEGQASIVDEWFGANGAQKPPKDSPVIPMNLDSPYFQYIDNNIRTGEME